MVGSRLYFRLVNEVLGDGARFESVMDDIVQEVRRRAPDAGAMDRRPSSAAALATASLLPPEPQPQPQQQQQHSAPMAHVVGQPAAGGSSVKLTMHSNSNIQNSNSSNVSNNSENCGNTNTSTSTLFLM